MALPYQWPKMEQGLGAEDTTMFTGGWVGPSIKTFITVKHDSTFHDNFKEHTIIARQAFYFSISTMITRSLP